MKFTSEQFLDTEEIAELRRDAEKEALVKLIDMFINEVRNKALKEVNKGHRGWDSLAWLERDILICIKEQIEKSVVDPVDIALYCAFLWNRGE